MNQLQSIFEKVKHADVSGVAVVSPLEYCKKLSKIYNNNIYMKREDTQSVFSFKCRGAYNKIRQLSNHESSNGIIAASAGNHAQGVALAAQQLNISATIVMPETTPKIKVAAVKELGANVVLHGDSYDDAYNYSLSLKDEHNYTFIHPYDDEDVIAGQGTIALEVIEQLSEPIDIIFVAVGGGGLLAGILSVFKILSPNTKVIGVEPENSNCLTEAIKAKKRVILDNVGIFTDGVAVKQIGNETFKIIEPHVDDTICVSIDEICTAIKDIYEETRSIVEPAGALSLAGMKKYCPKIDKKNLNIVTINCGANMNFDRLRHIAERTDIGENKESILAVKIPEKPGSLKQFCECIGNHAITEFNYRYHCNKTATIFVGIRHDENSTTEQFIKFLNKNNYETTNLSNNECAKIHVRHMVGGLPSSGISNEQFYRFQFPERPKALLSFLNALQNRWNITLFHYRNHGAAYGRVLVGLDVPKEQNNELENFIENIEFRAFKETDNVAINLFCK